ncbi:MAG: serine hydrolase [Cytophagales bacterium]|nr:serine hydrolase [Cytophagales bacterium]
MIKIVFSGALLVFFTFTISAQPSLSSKAADQWVDSIYDAMSLDARIGQLFMVEVYSGGNEQHHQVIEQLVKKNYIGGLAFSDGDPVKQALLTNRFQAQAQVPLLIGMDVTTGMGTRLEGAAKFPKPLTLGAIQNNDLITKMASEIARQMKVLGVHINFSPLANLYDPMGDPSLNALSFGDDPRQVTGKVWAYTQGLQDHGVLAVAKYFPARAQSGQLIEVGPGADPAHRKDTLTELSPFYVLSREGVGGIMTRSQPPPVAHAKTKKEEAEEQVPLSVALKNEWGFNGLLFTGHPGHSESTTGVAAGSPEKWAFLAGSDIILFSTQIPAASKQIKRIVKKDDFAKEQLERSVKKILKTKYQANLPGWQPINTDNLAFYLATPEASALKYELYRGAVTLVKDDSGLLPVKTVGGKYFASLCFGEGDTFQNTLDNYAYFSHYQKSYNDESILLKQLKNHDIVFIGIFQSLLSEEIEFLKTLSDKMPVIINHFGDVQELEGLIHASHLLHIEENTPATQTLVAEACFGANDVTGRIPVSLPGSVSNGTGLDVKNIERLAYDLPENVHMDSRVLAGIDEIMHEAILDQATPGAQVLVAKDGKIVFEKAYGYYTYDSLKPVTQETIYDVASITKVAATMQAFMFLHERSAVDLDKKISIYLPELKGSNKENMILRDILTHQAGLWPYLPFWKRTLEDSAYIPNYYHPAPAIDFQYQVSPGLYSSQTVKDSVWNWVKDSKLVRKNRRQPYPYRYSDMGYYLVQRLVEGQLNQPMEEFLQHNFYNPMGLISTGYLPLCRFPLSRIAPTEDDDYFRNTLVYGLVHDQGAALMGGVAGHAGLFSNALDLAKLMQMHLQGGTYGGYRFLQPGTVGLFTAQQYDSNRRGLGWDKPATAQWYGPASRFTSGKAFGHTGFTGTAAWADPKFNLVYVFLSNRIHPDAGNRKLIQNNIRTRIQEVIYKAIWSYTQYDQGVD